MASSTGKYTYLDWAQYQGDTIPSTLQPFPIFYEKVKPGQSILDIGCGEGIISLDLLAKGFGSITGIDVNEDGVRRSNASLENRPEEQKARCKFEQRDGLNSGYPDNAFYAGIMQAFLTTLTTPLDRVTVLKEARRILQGGLYLAVFMQTWNSPLYYERYMQGERETGKLGSFYARDSDSGDILYQAHHYSERELVDLLREAGWVINYWSYEQFLSRTGNAVNGAVIWATTGK
ncbi:MAG: class I SAM-dependent methyltransferase [Candidatus Hinthialibacter antarcticus]|nr:class I SAM-dependent methyltransferase [Candidatus Hinthialibacter antarcticus]